MKTIIPVIFIIFCLNACNTSEDQEMKTNSPMISLIVSDIKSIELINGDKHVITTDSNVIKSITESINNNTSIGFMKGIVENNLTIYLNSKGKLDTLKINVLGSCFKVKNKIGDWTYESPILKSSIDSFWKEQEIVLLQKIQILWDKLTLKKGGCLTGGQYVKNGNFGNEGCILIRNEWNYFFNFPKSTLVNFLIKEMDDTSKTKIHTCPFKDATKGELAVYCLQKVTGINWYDFSRFSKYKNKEVKNKTLNHQDLLLLMLKIKGEREALKRLFLDKK